MIGFLADHYIAIAIFMDGYRPICAQHHLRIIRTPIVPAAAQGDGCSRFRKSGIGQVVFGIRLRGSGRAQSRVSWDTSGQLPPYECWIY